MTLEHVTRSQHGQKETVRCSVVLNPPFSYRWKITDALGDDVRFIKASEHFEKGKRQNRLSELAK